MGERFGDYEIEGRLGVGGMAEVYAARRSGPEGFVRRVCLKRVLAGNEGDRDAVTQLQDEARLCARLAHPSIATVHELGRVDGKWFLVMELVDGMDLRSLTGSLRQRGACLPMDVALHVVRSVAEALAYAHALEVDGTPAQLVHRDVTPSNVLVSIHGEVKLADFGIARSTLRTHRTRSGVVKGKIPYMAPEQALGDALDRRTDVFALGVMLFELLAGRRPHDGQTDLETLTNAQRGRRPSLRDLAPETPEPVLALVTGMLAARPDDRTACADEVARVLAGLPVPRDPRRALAALVSDARRSASGAPPTRARAPRARVLVDAGPGAAPAVEEGPTEIEREAAPGTAEATAALQSARIPSAPRRWMLAIFAAATVLTTMLVVGVSAIALGSDAISRALQARGRDDAHGTSATKSTALASAPAPAPTHEPTLPPAPPPAEQPAPAPADEAGAPAREERHHRRASHASGEPAHLQVVAIPYGDVAIDGHDVGRTPVSVTLAPGAHTVVVTNGETRGERRVSLEPGATQRVLVDLLGD